MLIGRNLSLVYTEGGLSEAAVDDACITIGSGEFVGIVGPSGSGKSSLLYLLSGLKRPTGGEVSYEGSAYSFLRESAVRKLRLENFGFVFQQHFLINYLKSWENVLVSTDGRFTKGAAVELLEKVGVAGQAEKYPYQMSIGQRQRVAVARALICKPKVIFADEPTASLDHAAGGGVIKALSEFRAKSALVVVTHDPEILIDADRILTMRDGRLSEEIVVARAPA